MKQFVLIALIAFPTLLLAQPTLTFSPANNATNVSITNNLTISSDQALKTTAGVNLDDTNVDALIQLLDESLNPVAFDATINGGRTTITINPTASLLEEHNYTLIFQPVENNAGEETTTKTILFQTGDFTDPSIAVAKGIDNTGAGFTFRVNVDEGATVYYVVDTDNTVPSTAEVRSGDNGDGNPAEASGSFTVTANTDVDEIISGLDFTPPVKFFIYYFAEDDATPVNTGAVATRGIPLLNSSSIPGASVQSNQFDLRVNVDETVTTYYVVTTSAVAPSSSQILAGQNESGGAPFLSGNFNVGTANTNVDHTITGLDDLTTYYVHFVSTDGSGNETVVTTKSATTTDGTGPVVVTLSPPDGATGVDISTNTFTITFDENVSIINAAAANNDQRIRLFENGVMVEDIDRNDGTVGTDGSIVANGSSNVATVTFVYTLLPQRNYHIIIGDEVFQDAASNPFLGLTAATDWNFTSSGVTINNTTSNICSGSFQSIANIVISETGVGDFNNGAAQTLVLSLENTSEFVISNSGVTVSGLSADVTSLSVSVGLTSLTVTYTVAGGTVLDNITISGLKIYATGVVASTTIRRTGGTANQDGNNGTGGSSLTYSTINVGATPPSAPQLEVAQDLIHCVGEDITAKTLTLVDQGVAVTYNWYRDASLTDLAVSTANETINIVTDLGLTSPAVLGSYKFYLVAVSACQSAPPVEVVIQVGANPVADAGTDRTGPAAVCSGTQLTLGGNPTLAVPSAAGAYNYAWEYIESAPEPDPVANPAYTVMNASTSSPATYNFQVTVTDVNGCSGSDVLTVEVKPTFNIALISPNSYTFTPNSPNQTLVASPAGGVFSGVGVVQSNAPATYQFSPAIAHATDPNTLPKNFNIYYTVTDNGCTQSNYLIATFTIANSFFSSLQPEYCSSEYPNPNSSGVTLRLDVNGYNYVDSRKTSWNTNERFSRGPYNTQWVAGNGYSDGSYVRYNNEIYRCNSFLLGCSGFTPPDAGGQWVYENILRVNFNGLIGNYYEDYYGGNSTGSTIVKLGSTYTVSGQTYNEYRFGTNAEYNYCATCTYAWPAAYLEFERPEDIRLMLPGWYSNYYYYRGDIVTYLGNVYQCTANPYTTGTAPDLNPGLWAVVTNSDYSNGQYFHKFDAGIGAFRSGFYVNGQYVQINKNPTVFFSGLANGQGVCEFDVLNLDNQASSTGITYDLTGNFANQNFIQSFAVKLEGSGVFNDGGGTIANDIINPGKATFDTRNAFVNSTTGAPNVKNVEIQYQVNPGTEGSTGQPCFGTSSIVVQVVQNSSFDFDSSVDPNGSVYCYTEGAKGLRSAYNAVTITGNAGTPNSVTYSGYGVNDLGNSRGAFRPGIAIDQLSPGTTTQQAIPVTAIYRDANQCRSMRVRTFDVNPDIQPSFTFGGRVNYCYEDIANSFIGHFQDFTDNSTTVTSTGKYEFEFKDPAGVSTTLQTVNSNNTSFLSKPFYDQVQGILTTGNFTSDLNQTANINVIYTETLNAGKSCSETFSQTIVVNPPIMLDIFGLKNDDVLCRNDNSNVTQGNLVSFEGSVSGSGIFKLDDDFDFTAVNPTLNGTVNTNAGKASINLLTAYNAASGGTGARKVYLQYEYTAPGCTGPAQVYKGFEISPPPSLSFDFTNGNSPDPLTTIFCNGDAPVQLKTTENLNVTLSGYGITDSGTGAGTATFNPQLAFSTSVSNGGSSNAKQNITVTAKIVDVIGCVNTTNVVYVVNPIPPTDVTFEETDFCYENAPGLISSPRPKSWYKVEYLGVTTPHTENIGSISSNVASFSFDPKQRFNEATGTYGASTLTPVNFNVYYYTADADNCIATEGPTLVSVANQIDVTIAGLDTDQIYCSNENNGKKSLTFNPFPADASKRQFTINGTTEPLSSDKFTFEPGLTGGDFVLRYVVFSGENNCSNTDTVEVKVLPSPEAIFQAPPACDGDIIQYTALGNNLGSAAYRWTLSDSVITGQSVQHRFPATNIYGVQLYVAYPAYNNDPALVCRDSLRLDQTVGAVPKDLNFKFFNVCENDNTTFELQPDVPISQLSWDFADGAATGMGFSASQIPGSVPNTTGTYQAPSHRYASENTYNVVVTGKTAAIFGGCQRVETHQVAILKNWAPTPTEPAYDMSQLDGGKGFWVVEDVNGNSSWTFNSVAKQHIVTSDPTWVTGDSAPYKDDDNSYVNSPCFDLSSFSRPVFSLDHWTDTELADGAVVQYSIDGGKNWNRLGNVATGLDWYNKLTISSNPGEQTDLTSGWSFSDQRAWATGKHTLDVLPVPRTQVRFRVAFRSYKSAGKDGFAFKNVVIEERNRTILVENFTNMDAASNNAAFQGFRAPGGVFNIDELVKLEYHHAIATQGADADTLHNMNPIDQNARAAFYGVTNPVRAFVDGGFGQSSSNATFESPGLDPYFSLRSLVTSPVNISIDLMAEGDPAQLNVRATVQATNDVPPGRYNVFVAIAEQNVFGQIYVLRKFLPNAAGTPLTVRSATDPAQEINVSYDMRQVTRLPDGSFAPFAVIVFVQNLETKDVLQTLMRRDGTASPNIVTGIETPYDQYLSIYPNPADAVVNITLPAAVAKDTPLKLFDSFGRQVYNDVFRKGDRVKAIDTKRLSSGVYLIQVAAPEGLVQKKVMVVHE